MLDESESDQRAHEDEIGLLQDEWALGVYTEDTPDSKVPNDQCRGENVEWNVARYQHSSVSR